ncbi:MAG TPA: Nif3-like dinuclear metal center hexameric protein [Deltaproteobacteria bacterium]|nr:Nif3-like dinuclear metal center hexameric protein [Deltaproteobacteria bacterium]
MTRTIESLVAVLEEIAPLAGAADWDNTGLLLRGMRAITRVGLCIDLTGPVWSELRQCDAIVAYHPPIFRGLKRLDGSTPRQATLLDVIRQGVHVYAPHTALDAAPGAMGDWLLQAFGEPTSFEKCRPIQPAAFDPRYGVGRRARLAEPRSLQSLLPRLKSWLGLSAVRCAGDMNALRTSVAVCPGSGGSVLAGLDDVDILLTGELGHHEVLAHVAAGGAVVLTDHTNTERGYLPRYAARIRAACPDVSVVVSAVDSDPLVVV